MARKKSKTTLISRPEVIAFLRDAKENPEDNTPLLILADWLEERGDPRGEFLRLDLKFADDELSHERRNELLSIHKEEWLGPLGREARCEIHRGLVELGTGPATLLQRAWSDLAGSELFHNGSGFLASWLASLLASRPALVPRDRSTGDYSPFHADRSTRAAGRGNFLEIHAG